MISMLNIDPHIRFGAQREMKTKSIVLGYILLKYTY